jgi:DNA-binding CsgD family transcriptional regulator
MYLDHNVNISTTMELTSSHACDAEQSNQTTGFNEGLDSTYPSSVLLDILDELDYGVMLLDTNARLQYANKAAHQVLHSMQGLQLKHGVLSTVCSGQASLFRATVHDAGKGKRGMILLGPLHSRLPISFVPLTVNDDVSERLFIKVIMGKPSLCEAISLHFFAKCFALTNAESNVLNQLSIGLSVTQIAEKASLAVSTVRTQLKQICAKTGTHSQTQLLSNLGKLPPMPNCLTVSKG